MALDYPSTRSSDLGLSARLDRNEALRDAGLLLIRAALAAVFVFHGAQKLFGVWGGGGLAGTASGFGAMGLPLPYASAVAAGSAEFFGGLLLLLGLLVRPAALVMAFTMAVATFVHLPNGFALSKGGAEYALTLLLVLSALVLLGGGRLGVGRLFAAGRREPVLVPAH